MIGHDGHDITLSCIIMSQAGRVLGVKGANLQSLRTHGGANQVKMNRDVTVHNAMSMSCLMSRRM